MVVNESRVRIDWLLLTLVGGRMTGNLFFLNKFILLLLVIVLR